MVGKLYFCNAHPRGKEFRGAAGKILFGALRFSFAAYKKTKKVISVSGADPDFLETYF